MYVPDPYIDKIKTEAAVENVEERYYIVNLILHINYKHAISSLGNYNYNNILAFQFFNNF